MALFKAMVPKPNDHNILIPVEDATFGLPVKNIYVSKEEVFQFSRMEHISATCVAEYMKYITLSWSKDNDNMDVEFNF